jgi:uncharacterized membrane protein YeiH
MDLIGIYTVAFITALGGGTIRDILLNRYPIFWVIHPEYALGIFILSVITALVLRYKQIVIRPYAIIVPDIFKHGGHLYATCALSAAVMYIIVKSITNDHASAATASLITATILRLLSVKFDITLPI